MYLCTQLHDYTIMLLSTHHLREEPWKQKVSLEKPSAKLAIRWITPLTWHIELAIQFPLCQDSFVELQSRFLFSESTIACNANEL